MTEPLDLYCTALGMQERLLRRERGNHLRWLGAADAFIAELERGNSQARMAGAKVGAMAIGLAVARGRFDSSERALEAFAEEVRASAKERLPRPLEAAREARGAFVRALVEVDADRIDAALWALGQTAARAVLSTRFDAIDAAVPGRRR